MNVTKCLMSAGIPGRIRNSRQEFLLKLMNRGADEVMTIERTAEILGVRRSTIHKVMEQGRLKMVPAVAIEDIAQMLYLEPGIIPKIASARESATELTEEQFSYIGTVADRLLEAHPMLGMERQALLRALAISYLRHPNKDWHYAIDLLADKLISKLLT